jgi:hypothetical protein
MNAARSVLLYSVLLAGCFGPDGDDASSSDGSVADASLPGDWRLTHACRSSDPHDAIDVMSARVDGDMLLVQVGHGGGCEQHEYSLCFAEAWQEEVPVQAQLTVLHDAHGDGCEAFLTTEVSFDLLPIAEEFEARYQHKIGTVRLLLDASSPEAPDAHDYSFDLHEYAIEN